ncbi:hypothetical protein WA158_007998 [Blastocystis sp. Blastoise]
MGKSSKTYYDNSESCSSCSESESDGYSDGEEEDQSDYRSGGYHPVIIGDIYNDKYKIIKKLGWGQFSTVWLAEDLEISGRYYALKIQKGADKYRDAAEDELELLSYIMKMKHDYHVHPPVVNLYDDFILYGASLLDLIKYYDYKGLPLLYVKKISYDMLEGLSFLHDACEIIHTDLKPENVLLTYPPLTIPEFLPVPTPPQCEISVDDDEEIVAIRSELANLSLLPEDKLRLKNQLKNKIKKLKADKREKLPPIFSAIHIYRFITTNFAFEAIPEKPYVLPVLKACEYQYPLDELYIKLFFICPQKVIYAALGKSHVDAQPEGEKVWGEWSYQFGDTLLEDHSNMFNIRGHGPDSYTRLHDVHDILTQSFENKGRDVDLLWSLRFDGRHCVEIFNILEHKIPNLHFLRFPPPVQTLSAFEHTLLASVKREFLPPNDTLFKTREGSYAGLYFDAPSCSLYPLPLETRMSDWPTAQELTTSASVDSVTLPPFFPEGVEIHAKIVDLGNSCFKSHHFTNYIQTRQYRSPEAILCAKYYTSTDIWSAACMIFELITGDYLFDPVDEPEGISKDEEHLAIMESILGTMNKNVFSNAEKSREFFNRNGYLRYNKGNRHWSISDILFNEYHIPREEAFKVEQLLIPMLTYDPKQRATASECLKNSWFDDVRPVVENISPK